MFFVIATDESVHETDEWSKELMIRGVDELS